MRATGSTSAQRGPDDTPDGLHPVLHITLGAGHEQERLRVGRHLLPLCGTTCKTGRQGLLQGSNAGQHSRSPPGTPELSSCFRFASSLFSQGDTRWCFLSPFPSCQFVFMCSFVPVSKQKIIKSIAGHHEGNTPIPGQLQEVQSPLQLLCVLPTSVTHCVNYSLCVLPLV